jgi:hypothetical protein
MIFLEFSYEPAQKCIQANPRPILAHYSVLPFISRIQLEWMAQIDIGGNQVRKKMGLCLLQIYSFEKVMFLYLLFCYRQFFWKQRCLSWTYWHNRWHTIQCP